VHLVGFIIRRVSLLILAVAILSFNFPVSCCHPGRGKRFISSPKHPYWLWSLPSLLFSGYWGSSLGLKQPGYEINQQPAASSDVNNESSYK